VVGTVTKVAPGSDLFLKIQVKPAADLLRLEEVLIVTQVEEKAPEMTATGPPLRASDILAQRLPSVPEMPVTETAKAPAASPTIGSQPVAQVTPHAPGSTPSPATARLKSTGALPPPTKPAATQPGTVAQKPRAPKKPATTQPDVGLGLQLEPTATPGEPRQ